MAWRDNLRKRALYAATTLTPRQHEVRIGASVGLAVFPDDGGDSEELVKVADSLMYRNKRTKYAKDLGWPLAF